MHDNSKLLTSLNCINIINALYKWSSIHVKFTPSMPCRHTGGEEVQLHSFLTSALDTGVWSGRSPVPIEYGAGLVPEPVLTFWRREYLPYWDLNPRPSSP
jgi:hypothetical protein